MRSYIAFTLLLGFGLAAEAQVSNAPAPATGRGQQVRSPEILPDNRVTFRLSAPNATKVEVRGDFPSGFNPSNIEMTKDPNGVWSATVGPLKSEYYSYSFYVDGVATLDPRNRQIHWDITQLNWLIVPGAKADLYDVKNDVPHGTVSQVWYPAPSLKMVRRTYVYTPPGYESSNQRYPVLYLLHGGTQDETAWTNSGRAPEILDNLIASGKAKPMIVVMPNEYMTQTAAPDFSSNVAVAGGAGRDNMPAVDSMAADLIPFIDKTYRTQATRYSRAIAGLSMGGGQAEWIVFHRPELFGWVKLMSAAHENTPGAGITAPPPSNAADLRQPGITSDVDPDKFFAALPKLNAETVKQFRLFEMAIGNHDGLVTMHRHVAAIMTAKGITVHAVEVDGYIHEWPFWRTALVDLSQKLFQPAAK